MSIDRPVRATGPDSGFSLLETVIALALSGLAATALLATHRYFTPASRMIESRSAHIQTRNLVYQSLAQVLRSCPPGSACETVEKCSENLRPAGGEPRTTRRRAWPRGRRPGTALDCLQ